MKSDSKDMKSRQHPFLGIIGLGIYNMIYIYT